MTYDQSMKAILNKPFVGHSVISRYLTDDRTSLHASGMTDGHTHVSNGNMTANGDKKMAQSVGIFSETQPNDICSIFANFMKTKEDIDNKKISWPFCMHKYWCYSVSQHQITRFICKLPSCGICEICKYLT